MDDALQTRRADQFLDLVAMGTIADMMDSRVLETRYFCTKGLEQINNRFLKAIIDKQSFKMGTDKPLITDVQFYIAPLINAVFRVGDVEEKDKMFQACINSQDVMVDYVKRGGNTIKVSFEEDVAREVVNIKARQDRLKSRIVEDIFAKNPNMFDPSKKVVLLDVSNIDNSEMLGVISNELANKLKKPVLLVKQSKENSDMLSGSARSYEKFEVKELKSFLKETGSFEYLQGHENAFGVGIKRENLQVAEKAMSEKLGHIEAEDFHWVDFIINSSDFDVALIKQLHKLKPMYGNNLKEPFIVIKNLKAENVTINEKQTMMSWVYMGIKYIIFNPNQKTINALLDKNTELNAVGRGSINNYNNEKTYQFVIDDFEVLRENKEKEFFF